MKKIVILTALAALVTLTGCVGPYYGDGYYRDGYHGRYGNYYGGGYGYRGDYGRADPWRGYNRYYDGPRDRSRDYNDDGDR